MHVFVLNEKKLSPEWINLVFKIFSMIALYYRSKR